MKLPLYQEVAIKQASLGGNLKRFSALRNIRRTVPVFRKGVAADEAKYVQRAFPAADAAEKQDIAKWLQSYNASFFDREGRAILTTPRSRRHELVHAYQDLMPATSAPLSGLPHRLPVVGKYIGDTALELGARLAEAPAAARMGSGFGSARALANLIYSSPFYARRHAADASPSRFVWKAMTPLRALLPKDWNPTESLTWPQWLKNLF